MKESGFCRLFINSVLTIALSGIVSISWAQKSKADKLYNNKQFFAATQLYEKELSDIMEDDIRQIYYFNIGSCYLGINKPQAALPWLKLAVERADMNAECWYLYGTALQQTGNYRDAIRAFEKCVALQPSNQTAASRITSCQFAIRNNSINPYTQFRLATEVNTAGSEYGISPLTGGVILYSVAGIPANNAKIDQRTGLQYVEPYTARVYNKKIINAQPMGNMFPDFLGATIFAYDSTTYCAYFTYCDPETNRCGIYTSNLKNNKWSQPYQLLQNKKYSVMGHPALANGGKRLYFTSNSPDGMGQTDIWYMDQVRPDKWTDPVNAGPNINTPGREEFPFVYSDSLLFFASDGHPGFGGLDIFCVGVKDNVFGRPQNLRRPYNSPGDDFNLVMIGETGLMSSSRNELVNDDIYLFEGLPSMLLLNGRITDSGGKPVGNARVTLSSDGKVIGNTLSDSTGYYSFFLNSDTPSMLYVRALGYKPLLAEFKPVISGQFADYKNNIVLHLSSVEPVIIYLYDKLTGKPLSGRGIICTNNDGETQIKRTDEGGSFKLVAQENEKEYWIKFPDGNYITESVILNEEQKAYTLEVQSLNSELFKGWLRFKRDSTEPVEMSQPLIHRIASVIKANPGLIFEISGFRDSGPEIRSENLAGQRAEYLLRRLVEDGVDRNQLIVKSLKQSTIMNSDASEEQNINERKVEIRARR